ncbi:rab11 family-interacting protein 1-like [Mustelus asterias]
MSLLAQSQKWYPTHVKVVVIRARGLRSKGKDGTNDAYAIMQLGKEKFSSSVAEKSGAPLWREEAEFELPALQSANQEKCTLYLIVMHRALVGLDKFLGQVAVNLNELYESKTRNKVGWYKLQSKNGKKEKERGEIEADIQFVRNNMTASMFDLSMKDKSRSTLGRLKDKFKGKKKDGFSDSASAIVPSLNVPGDSDDDTAVATAAADKKKKSKLKKLFPKSNLQRTSLSQSMSVIPTDLPSSPGNSKKARNFEKEDFTEIQLHDSAEEESSNKTLYVPKIRSHKRAASADTKQLNFAAPGNVRKDPLFLFGGLKPKSDPMSQSNLCINGSHVYTEEPGPPTPARLRTDPKPLYSSQFYTSAEDLTGRSSADPPEAAGPVSPSRPSRGSSPGDQPPVSASPPNARAEGSVGDPPDPQRLDRVQEEKESQPLAASTGRKGMEQKAEASGMGGRSLNPFDDEVTEGEKTAPPVAKPEVPKAEQVTKKEETRRGGLMSFFPRKTEAVKAPEAKETRNPFEERTEEVKKPPSNSVWSSRTAAVKPKLEVSPKAETKAETLSPLVPPSPPLLSALTHPSSPAPAMVAVGSEGATNSNFASLHVAYSPPAVAARPAPPPASPSPSVEESIAARLPPLPSSSSSSWSSDAETTGGGDSSAADPAGGRERRALPRGSGRTSARALLRELTGKNSSSSDGSPQQSPDGEGASAAEVEERGGSPGDWSPRSSPECQSNSGDEARNVTGEPADSRAEVCLEPKSSLHLPSSPLLETNISANPPQVPPRSCPPDSEGVRNPVKLAAEVRRVPPTPAPRNFAAVTINNNPMCSPEEISGQDLATGERATDGGAEPKAEPTETGGADFTPSAVGTPDEESATGSWGDNDRAVTSVGSADELHAVSPPGTYRGDASRNPVAGLEGEIARPGWLVAIPGKVEDSTRSRPAAAGNTRRPGSPLPLVGAASGKWAGETHGHTSPPLDPGPDPTSGTDVEHLGARQLEATEESTGNGHGLLETSVRAPETHDRIVAAERSEASDGTPTLGGKSENAVAPEDGQPMTRPGSSDLSRCASPSTWNQSTPSGKPTGERQPESRVTPPPTRAQAPPPPPDPSAGPSLPPPLPPLLPQPPLLQPTPPPVTDAPCSVQPSAGNSPGADTSGTRRPAQARVSPTETQPIQSQGGGSAMSSRRRPHPVKPMNAADTKPHEVTSEEALKPSYKTVDSMVIKSPTGRMLGLSESQTVLKDYNPSDPAAAYAQLTHDELIQLVLKQKEVISKKDRHVRELESYIDNLLVRVMEETPGILRVSYQPNRQAERV